MFLFIIVQNKHMVWFMAVVLLTSIKVALFYSPSYRHVAIIIDIVIITCTYGKTRYIYKPILPCLFNNAKTDRYITCLFSI